MRPIVMGLVVAVAVIGAFVLGQTVFAPEPGPAEEVGQEIDEAIGAD